MALKSCQFRTCPFSLSVLKIPALSLRLRSGYPEFNRRVRVGACAPSLAFCCLDFPKRTVWYTSIALLPKSTIFYHNLTPGSKNAKLKMMVKKTLVKSSKTNPISQILIILAVVAILLASYEAVTQNDITSIAPTQLFLLAGVLGILGLYLKDEK